MTQPGLKHRNWFLLTLLVAQILLMICTWPLWDMSSSFPAVPLFSFLAPVPAVADSVLTVVLVGTCLVAAINIVVTRSQRFERSLLLVALPSALSLAALNQHRLQPWHWLFILIVAQAVMLKGDECRRLNRLTIASVYIFAGLSRLGFHAADGMSRQILSLSLTTIGLEEVLHDENTVYWLCVGMTLGEAATGCLLLNQRARRLGVVLSIAMHIFLLLVLGPFGLKHHAGVQIWNLFFVIAVPALFTDRHNPPQSDSTPQWRETAFATFVILFPLCGLFGIADNWPSWQVYSPRPEVVRVFISNSAVEKLPEPLKKFLGRPAPLEEWTPLRVDAWSLKTVNAPIYPQERFGVAVAWAVAKGLNHKDVIIRIERPQLAFWKPHLENEIKGMEGIGELKPQPARMQ